MLTVEKLQRARALMEAHPEPMAFVLPRWTVEALGLPGSAHRRSRGARGRKRALLESWHPLPRMGLCRICGVPPDSQFTVSRGIGR